MSFPKIHNVVYKGGGAKGFIDIGVGLEFDRLGLTADIKNVAGTSVGALFSLFFASGKTAEEIQKIAFSTNFERMINNHWSIIDDYDLLREGYLHDGKQYHQFLRDFIGEITGNKETTLEQWQQMQETHPAMKSIMVEACNDSRGINEVFSSTNPRLKNQPLWKAIAASSAVPWYFKSITLDLTAVGGASTEVFCDGGIQNNCPVDLFRTPEGPSPNTIGVWMASRDEIAFLQHGTLPPVKHATGLKNETKQVVESFFERDTFQLANSGYLKYMILCDNLGVGTLDFNISDEVKKMLVLSGKVGTLEYFCRHYPEFAAMHYSEEMLEQMGITKAAIETPQYDPKLKRTIQFADGAYERILKMVQQLPKAKSDVAELATAIDSLGLSHSTEPVEQAVDHKAPSLTFDFDNKTQHPTASAPPSQSSQPEKPAASSRSWWPWG